MYLPQAVLPCSVEIMDGFNTFDVSQHVNCNTINYYLYDGDHKDIFRWTKVSGVGWYFNKFFPHTSVFEDLTYRIIETGLLVPWKQWTYAEMRSNYLQVHAYNSPLMLLLVDVKSKTLGTPRAV